VDLLAAQGCRTLLLCDNRAFFLLCSVVSDAGLRAQQLDRDGALARARAPPAALSDAAKAAAGAAECVLATHEQAASTGFPWDAFHLIVEYDRQALSSVLHAADAALAAAPCPRHVQLGVRLTWAASRANHADAGADLAASHAHATSPAQSAGSKPPAEAQPQHDAPGELLCASLPMTCCWGSSYGTTTQPINWLTPSMHAHRAPISLLAGEAASSL